MSKEGGKGGLWWLLVFDFVEIVLILIFVVDDFLLVICDEVGGD